MLAQGTRLQNRYHVIRLLGQGGMGAVHEAWDERLDCPVAVKQINREFLADTDLRRAFEREAKLLARLHHPALPRVSDHFDEEDGQFLVMQLVGGKDLHELMTDRGETFPLHRVMSWADKLLDALEYLHGQNPPILHRDIKPANIKLTEKNELFLLDFGLAGGLHTSTSRVSVIDRRAHTPGYSPLEQIKGIGMDARSDLYAFGATLYHLITGIVPADAEFRGISILTSGFDPLRPLDEIHPNAPPALSTALQQTLAMNANLRPASASVLRQLLREAVADFSRKETVSDLKNVLSFSAKSPEHFITVPIADREESRQVVAANGGGGVIGAASPVRVKVVKRLVLPQTVTNRLGIEFVLIPAGAFSMGSAEGKENNAEKPRHRVGIEYPFYLGKHQVTQKQWQMLMGGNPSHFKIKEERPVESISWHDAQEFVKRLNALDDGYVYRLPSEAEWEYACRAGTTTPFAFGKTLTTDKANYNGNTSLGAAHGIHRRRTMPPGSFRANPWGLHDMHGNVREWCQDVWHADYQGAPPDGSAWETDGDQGCRVLRGGSWQDSASSCRSASRDRFPAWERHSGIGLRVAMAARKK